MDTSPQQIPQAVEQKPVALPALRFAFLLAAGLVAARLAPAWWPAPAAALACLGLLFLVLRNRAAGRLCGEGAFLLLVVMAAYGLARLDDRAGRAGSSHGLPLGAAAALCGRVEGPAWPVPGPSYEGVARRRCLFRAESFLAAGSDTCWRACSSSLLLTLPQDPRLPLAGGERLGLVAQLIKPSGYANPGGFDYRQYLLERSITAEALVQDPEGVFPLGQGRHGLADRLSPSRWASSLRAAAFERHGRLYKDNRVRAVASALLLGAREQLPPLVRRDFTDSGTMHVLVVSGLHVGFVAGALYLAFSLVLGRGWACSSAVSLAVLFFALVCGARPSVLRASLMCAFVLMALPLQRKKFLLNILAAAFALILLARPGWIADMGFQLSFAAVAGIGLLEPRLEKAFQGRTWWSLRPARWLVQLALASLAAQAAVTPLLAYYFLRVSPAALAANLLIVPLAGCAVVTGLVADLLAFIWLPMARAAALFFDIWVKALLWLARFFAGLPGACLEVSPPALHDIILWWLAAFFAAAALDGKKYLFRLAVVCLIWLNLHLWAPAAAELRGELTMHFLDLGGRGHAAVLHLPGRRVLFLDARGGRGGVPVREVVIPYLARYCGSGIDLLVLQRCDRAGISACREVLECFKVGSLVVPPVVSRAPFYREFLEACLARGVALAAPVAADTLDLGRARLVVLGPGRYWPDHTGRLADTSGAGLLSVVEYAGRRVLLAGAVQPARLEETQAGRGLPAGCDLAELPSGLGTDRARSLPRQLDRTGAAVIVPLELHEEALLWAAAGQGRLTVLSTPADGAVGLRIERSGKVRLSKELERGGRLSGW